MTGTMEAPLPRVKRLGHSLCVDAKSLEVVLGGKMEEYRNIVFEGLCELNHVAPLGYEAKEMCERIVQLCNRIDQPGWVFIACHDPARNRMCVGWGVASLFTNMMGTQFVHLGPIWAARGYKSEAFHAMMPATKHWAKAMGCERGKTLSVRYDKQNKLRCEIAAYTKWALQFGFRERAVEFEFEL